MKKKSPILQYRLLPLAGRPGLPGLKCTNAAAPTYQQTLVCGLWGLKLNVFCSKMISLPCTEMWKQEFTHSLLFNKHSNF